MFFRGFWQVLPQRELYYVCKGKLNDDLGPPPAGVYVNFSVVGNDKAINDVHATAFDFAGSDLFDLISGDLPRVFNLKTYH